MYCNDSGSLCSSGGGPDARREGDLSRLMLRLQCTDRQAKRPFRAVCSVTEGDPQLPVLARVLRLSALQLVGEDVAVLLQPLQHVGIGQLPQRTELVRALLDLLPGAGG